MRDKIMYKSNHIIYYEKNGGENKWNDGEKNQLKNNQNIF